MINLLSWRERQARRQRWRFFIRAGAPSFFVVVGFITVCVLERQYRQKLTLELKNLTAEVKAVEQIYAEKTSEMKEQILWKRKLERWQSHKHLRGLPLPMDVLPDKSSAEGISLLALHCQRQQCSIEGRVGALFQLRPFIDGLASETHVRNLRIEQLKPVSSSEGSSRFMISFQIGRNPF